MKEPGARQLQGFTDNNIVESSFHQSAEPMFKNMLKICTRDANGHRLASNNHEMPDCRPLRILQVEDTPADAELTDYAMRDGVVPYSLQVVTDGAQALAFLKRSEPYCDAARPDLILLDMELPGVTGDQVLEFIKSDDDLKTIPVIIFSSYDTEDSKKHAYELYANSYVVKPMDMATFKQRVQSIAEYWRNTSEVAV